MMIVDILLFSIDLILTVIRGLITAVLVCCGYLALGGVGAFIAGTLFGDLAEKAAKAAAEKVAGTAVSVDRDEDPEDIARVRAALRSGRLDGEIEKIMTRNNQRRGG